MAKPADRIDQTIEELEQAVLRLPDGARARIAQALLLSLDDEDDVARAWYDEAERRVREYRAGREIPLDYADVIAELRKPRG